LPAQQPFVQRVGSHWQPVAVHTSPVGHACPPFALQLQWPEESQLSDPAPHLTHAFPLVPHEPGPGKTQVPVWSQQPVEQLDGLQLAVTFSSRSIDPAEASARSGTGCACVPQPTAMRVNASAQNAAQVRTTGRHIIASLLRAAVLRPPPDPKGYMPAMTQSNTDEHGTVTATG
jgi:hypothetical protein